MILYTSGDELDDCRGAASEARRPSAGAPLNLARQGAGGSHCNELVNQCESGPARTGGLRKVVAVLLVGTITVAWSAMDDAPAAAAIDSSGLPRLASRQASPTTGIDGRECTVEPRPLADYAAISGTPGFFVSSAQGTPIATPAPPTGGVPADAETVDEIRDTMSEWVACINDGDVRRAAALHTNEFFSYLYGGVGTRAVSQDTGTPPAAISASAEVAVLQSIQDVRLLDDRRVSAITRINGRRALTLFALENGRYLIDGSFPATTEGTPTP